MEGDGLMYLDEDMHYMSLTERRDNRKKVAEAGGAIEYKGHRITCDDYGIIVYIDDERPNGWSTIQAAKSEIDRRER